MCHLDRREPFIERKNWTISNNDNIGCNNLSYNKHSAPEINNLQTDIASAEAPAGKDHCDDDSSNRFIRGGKNLLHDVSY